MRKNIRCIYVRLYLQVLHAAIQIFAAISPDWCDTVAAARPAPPERDNPPPLPIPAILSLYRFKFALLLVLCGHFLYEVLYRFHAWFSVRLYVFGV